jgi:hypothetical protein
MLSALFSAFQSPEGMVRFVLQYAGYETTGPVPFGHALHLTTIRGIR